MIKESTTFHLTATSDRSAEVLLFALLKNLTIKFSIALDISTVSNIIFL